VATQFGELVDEMGGPLHLSRTLGTLRAVVPNRLIEVLVGILLDASRMTGTRESRTGGREGSTLTTKLVQCAKR
jgi:hypothetical protein